MSGEISGGSVGNCGPFLAKNGKKFKEQVSAASALVAFEWVFGSTCEPLTLASRVSLASLVEAEVA